MSSSYEDLNFQKHLFTHNQKKSFSENLLSSQISIFPEKIEKQLLKF